MVSPEAWICLGAIIFDFDGVIADSDALANQVLADALSQLGLPTSLEQALSRYSGRRWAEAVAVIEEDLGASPPAGFWENLKSLTLERFRGELRDVAGAGDFIRSHANRPCAIASSSSSDRLQLCLRVLGLGRTFEGRVFSTELVRRGKPHPDIFLLAAHRLGVPPKACLVIEDSPLGVAAALAADMTAIGLCAASHIRDGHAYRLLDAGARRIAYSWAEVDGQILALVPADPTRL